MMQIEHSNRGSHNWLIYDIADRFLLEYSDYLKGAIIDLGCGESPYKQFFLTCAESYVGVDWNNTNHRANVDVLADLNRPLPMCSSVADTVVCLSVLEHIYEPLGLLKEAFRILRPSGHLILQVPWQWSVHEAPHDYFRYTPYGLKYLFQNAGFQEVTVIPQSGYFSTAVLKANYFSRRFLSGSSVLIQIIGFLLKIIWFLGQKVSPMLDRLDRDWSREASGYFVIAKKPSLQSSGSI